MQSSKSHLQFSFLPMTSLSTSTKGFVPATKTDMATSAHVYPCGHQVLLDLCLLQPGQGRARLSLQNGLYHGFCMGCGWLGSRGGTRLRWNLHQGPSLPETLHIAMKLSSHFLWSSSNLAAASGAAGGRGSSMSVNVAQCSRGDHHRLKTMTTAACRKVAQGSCQPAGPTPRSSPGPESKWLVDSTCTLWALWLRTLWQAVHANPGHMKAHVPAQ